MFLLIPPPASSTLFPYTTLFRSGLGSDAHHDLGVSVGNGERGKPSGSWDAPRSASGYSSLSKSEGSCNDGVAMQIGRAHVCSSHVSISYAVFCLKKKKHSNQLHT